MPPNRTSVLLAGALAIVGLLASCSSSDDASPPPTTRAQMTFQTTPPEATRLGVCTSFTTEQMQDLLGGDQVAAAIPEAIDDDGGAVVGESCSWELVDGEDTRSVRIEARDYGSDTAGLAARFEELEAATPEATELPGVQDAAFSASSDEASVVQVRLRQYLLTASSRGTGELEPLTAAELGVLLGTTFERLP